MESKIEALRRRLRESEREIERLKARDGAYLHAPSGNERTSAAETGLLFTAAEKTRMPQIVTDPNLPDNPIVFANRAFQELCGYGADELIGRNCRFLQGPGTDPSDVAKIRDAVAARRDVVVELLNYHRDGTAFRNELYVSPVFHPDGSLRYFFASQLDLTRFRTEESLLAESEMRFDATATPIDYRFVEANPAFETQTGLKDVVGRWVSEVVPDLEQSWLDVYGRVATTGDTVRFESGAVAMGRWFDVHALRIGDPVLRRVALLFTDITRRRDLETRPEATARDRTDERDMVWRTSRDLFLVCGFDGRYRAVNPAWTETLGWLDAELVGASFNDYILPDDRPTVAAVFADLAAGIDLHALDVRLRTKDGGFRWVSWHAYPRGDHFYAVGRDVTERKALEEQLRQSQKLEAVGQLTGGVAHDFNNLLTVIKSSTDLLRRPNLPEERRSRYVEAISDTVGRAAKLTGQLLAFARRQALQPEVFDVGRGVRSVADMVGTLTGARIRVETTVDFFRDAQGGEHALFVDADPSQFDTALVNMVVNARDAMEGEGRLRIRVRPAETVPSVRAHPARHGDFVAVSISDTGAGIPPDALDRIFEPFFTTKGVGQGTGLGLSQVFGFAKQSGGEVVATSEVGRGTTFTLYLPRAQAVPMAEERPRDPAALADGHGTCVLVVEDNPEVGAFATQALNELGYGTVWARDAEQALAEMERSPYRFEVVFSDVMMPGMDGVSLAREIVRRRPELPVVLTSGYSEVLANEGTHGFALLRKPYSVADLSRTLRLAIEEAKAPQDGKAPSRSAAP